MSLGYDRQEKLVNLGDTAEIVATLYDDRDDPYVEDNLVSVKFTIQAPDGTKSDHTGEVQEDGTGTLAFKDTDQLGHYIGIATFRTEEGSIKSVRVDFETIDPFIDIEPSQSWAIANDAWEKFADCFDAEEEGPWLRDMTLNVFNKRKMENFIDDALMDINLQHPPTSVSLDEFVTKDPVALNGNSPLLTQALVIQIIKHLMRSYVEQPNPVGAQIAWHDRRDYLQRWKLILDEEKEQYKRMLALWKRQFLGLGSTVSLISAKSGRMLPAPMRSRAAGRGYW